MSIEVDPRLAHDTRHDHRRGPGLWWLVDRPNVMIKIPATEAGPAVDHRRHRRGHQRQRHPDLQPRPLRRGHGRVPHRPGAGRGERHDCRRSARSPRSSSRRVDTEIDKRLDKIGTDDAQGAAGQGGDRQRAAGLPGLRGGVRLDRWQALAAAGAQSQRPLWASTGVKDPAYDDTHVRRRAGRPGHRQHHARGHAGGRRGPRRVRGDTITGTYDAARKVIDALARRHRLRRRRRGARERGRAEVRGLVTRSSPGVQGQLDAAQVA